MDELSDGSEEGLTVISEVSRPPTLEDDEVSKGTVMRRVQDVDIPFASPRLLWRMKKNSHREKDLTDLVFLRQHYLEVTGDCILCLIDKTNSFGRGRHHSAWSSSILGY